MYICIYREREREKEADLKFIIVLEAPTPERSFGALGGPRSRDRSEKLRAAGLSIL